jgi:pimeloyl-ACP methyl ester carboxylesterase
VRGSGEPLLIIHGAILCGAFEGIARALSSSNKLITYHRRGFGGSSAARKDGTIADQAADAVALLDHLGEGAAHVVGHSYGGVVALQLAIDHPERVHTLALLEPPLLSVPGAADFASGVAAVAELYQSGDADGALVAFLNAVGGGDPVPRISETLPSGWHEQALTDLSVLFEADLPSISAWQFGEAEARSINQPALAVLGTESTPLFAESCELLKKWLPNAEPFVLDRAGHLLQIDNPDGMAKGLLAFLQRHPMRS